MVLLLVAMFASLVVFTILFNVVPEFIHNNKWLVLYRVMATIVVVGITALLFFIGNYPLNQSLMLFPFYMQLLLCLSGSMIVNMIYVYTPPFTSKQD